MSENVLNTLAADCNVETGEVTEEYLTALATHFSVRVRATMSESGRVDENTWQELLSVMESWPKEFQTQFCRFVIDSVAHLPSTFFLSEKGRLPTWMKNRNFIETMTKGNKNA